MARPPQPVFLERRSYRRRRLIDAVRIVVVLGLVLWMMPVMWPNDAASGATPIPLSQALFYVFGVWAGLIVLCAVLAVRLRDGRLDDAGWKAGAATDADRQA